jgi:hypothetical protein
MSDGCQPLKRDMKGAILLVDHAERGRSLAEVWRRPEPPGYARFTLDGRDLLKVLPQAGLRRSHNRWRSRGRQRILSDAF